jgi:hypothetical protein
MLILEQAVSLKVLVRYPHFISALMVCYLFHDDFSYAPRRHVLPPPSPVFSGNPAANPLRLPLPDSI